MPGSSSTGRQVVGVRPVENTAFYVGLHRDPFVLGPLA